MSFLLLHLETRRLLLLKRNFSFSFSFSQLFSFFRLEMKMSLLILMSPYQTIKQEYLGEGIFIKVHVESVSARHSSDSL